MKKNSQIHLWLTSKFKEELEQKAEENNVSLNEFCLQKLKEDNRLRRIEKILEELLKK